VTALLLLAAALGLSNLAASVGIGAAGVDWATRVRIAVVFGLFEAGMPVLGLVLGHGLADTIGHAARWLGGGVLVAFGIVGLVQAWRQARAGTGGPPASGAAAGAGAWWPGGGTGWRMLVGGLVLSADNLAAGFALGAYHTGLALAAVVFGVVSVAMSLAGLELGARIGVAAGERGELVACGLLIAVGAAIAAGAL
jgi:manganese efflux pump family protein